MRWAYYRSWDQTKPVKLESGNSRQSRHQQKGSGL